MGIHGVAMQGCAAPAFLHFGHAEGKLDDESRLMGVLAEVSVIPGRSGKIPSFVAVGARM